MAEALALAGTYALVTGGGSGIGLGCAKHLRRDGATVTLMGRSKERLDDGAAELAAMDGPGEVRTSPGDVAVEDDVVRAVETACGLGISRSEGPLGPEARLDFAVAAAGTGTLGPLVVTPLDQWQQVLDVNLTGAFLTIKHAAAAMARGAPGDGGGSIVVVSSIAAPLTHRYMAPYSVSKAGAETLVRNAADELGMAGVRVNAVRPGLVPTDLTAGIAADEDIAGDYLDQMPLRRLGTVDDVAYAVRFLLGPESSWVTGQCLGVDGGHHLRRGPDYETLTRQMFGDDAVEGRVER